MNTELQSKPEQSAVNFQGKTRKQKVHKDPNAPFIREIIDRTSPIKGERVKGDNAKEIKANVQTILKAQLRATQLNARTQTY